MPLFDFQCSDDPTHWTRDWMFRNAEEADAGWFPCVVRGCRGHMVRQPSVSSFKIEGFSAKNGYAKEA